MFLKKKKKPQGCEISQGYEISQGSIPFLQPDFVFTITFHPNSVLGNFGIVGNIRECKI